MANNPGQRATYKYRVSDGELLLAPPEWGEGPNADGTTWPAEAAAQEGLQEAAGQWDAEPGLHYGPVRLGGFVDGRWLSQDARGYEAGETNLYPYCYDTPASEAGELYHDVPNTFPKAVAAGLVTTDDDGILGQAEPSLGLGDLLAQAGHVPW
jgi:hypothetical protein